jgi:histidine triad (HIT) family protein
LDNNSCIFCKIAQRQAQASIIYEDDKVLAFLDIRPLNEGHTLIIPKEHYENVYDVPDDLIAHIHRIGKRTAIIVKNVTGADGITIIQQNGHAAGQEVFHLHIHVVPRYEGQKLPKFTDIPNASREQLNEMAERLKTEFKN